MFVLINLPGFSLPEIPAEIKINLKNYYYEEDESALWLATRSS